MATDTRPRTEADRRITLEEPARDAGFGAFWILRLGFGIAPILAGVDKFFNFMVEWEQYLWSGVENAVPWSAQQIMYVIGGVEILAGILVLLAPVIGGALVTIWLAAITTNLVIGYFEEGEYLDIALRDFGLMLGALALTVLATRYRASRRRRRRI